MIDTTRMEGLFLPLNVYLGERADYTHENRAFDRLASRLADFWKTDADNVALVGGFYWNGAQVDAAVFKRSCIILIDFKSYSGKLKFNENGPWLCDGVEVRGGSSKNPLRQLERCKKDIVNGPSRPGSAWKPAWTDVHALVVFDEVDFHEALPPKVGTWFGVTDLERAPEDISQRSSSSLNLGEDDISQLILALGVRRHRGYTSKTVVESIAQFDTNRAPEPGLDDASPGQRRVLSDLRRFVEDNTRHVHVITGMASTGKSQVISWAQQEFQSQGKFVRIIDTMPNSGHYIYTEIFDVPKSAHSDESAVRDEAESVPQAVLDPSLSERAAPAKPRKHIPIKLNPDRDSSIYFIDDAHLISSRPFDNIEDLVFGTNNLAADLMSYVKASANAKLVVDDNYLGRSTTTILAG